MEKLNIYSSEQRFLILLNRFILRYDESNCSKTKIIRDAYIFCVGYFLKYRKDYENPQLTGPVNILAVLTSAMLNPDLSTVPVTGNYDKVLYFYKFIVEYIVWNEYEVERTYRSHKLNFDKINSQVKPAYQVKRKF